MITVYEAYKKIGDNDIFAFAEFRNSYLFWSNKLFGAEEFYSMNKDTGEYSNYDILDIVMYSLDKRLKVPDDWDENYNKDYEDLIKDRDRIKPISEIFKEDNLKEAI